ncbi:MAG: NAD(P)/FAD-dependent oxidoreductase [Phycisphaerales bacterium]|nr:NAD(P)/FAD-dependent oxidoreductase [Phycisphaerales bacterium]
MKSNEETSSHLCADVVIVGGGPAGSTAGCLLKKYMPHLEVLILEKAIFPRDHVGESQLPMIGRVLREMGCWEKCEAAGFPIKVGATYRWGNSDELWDFNFVDPDEVESLARPAEYAGARVSTAWQVDRAIYDEILLNHAQEMGCVVRQQHLVSMTALDDSNPDRIDHLCVRNEAGDDLQVRGKYYVDASGGIGVLRKAIGINVDSPTSLQNVAFWDYWENAEWAVEIGVGGTRVQVLSIGTGWLWFIPLGPTRTSIGFVCPASYYKSSGQSPEELYQWAISQEPRVTELTKNATQRGEVEATKDWSFLADRLTGDNWLLAGESAGFADPILAGGMMLTHTSARHAAYTILELERAKHDPKWLKSQYDQVQRRRINQHIRFADFWYAGNGQFTDLEQHSSQIAKESGLNMRPKEAFRWLSTGGFADDLQGAVGIGGVDLGGVKSLAARFGGKENLGWELSKYNSFKLQLNAARKIATPYLQDGQVIPAMSFERAGRMLPSYGMFNVVLNVLSKHSELDEIMGEIQTVCRKKYGNQAPLHEMICYQIMESMLADGWVIGKVNKKRPMRKFSSSAISGNFKANEDELTTRIGTASVE